MKKFKEKQTGILSRSDLSTVHGKVLYWFYFAMLCLLMLVAVIPAIWTIATSFKDTQEIYSAATFFPKDMTWEKFVSRISYTWTSLQFGTSIINTILMSLGSLVVNIVVCGFGGYVLSKLKPTGTKLLFTLVVWTMMMPSQIRMVPNYISYTHFPFAYDLGLGVSLFDTYWPMWLGAGSDTFAVLLFKNSFDALSQSYVDAAKIDGCSNFGVFFRIMLPLAMPVVIFQAIGVLSGAWSDFFTPLLILENKSVVPLKIFYLQSNSQVQMNTYFMALVLASLPPFLIFAVFQKQIMGGVNIGGVKG